MKRFRVHTLCLVSLAFAPSLYGCDLGGLPTPSPVLPELTATTVPSAILPILTATPSVEPPTATSTPIPTSQPPTAGPTVEPSPTEQPVATSTLEEPTPTAEPLLTETPQPLKVRLTPTPNRPPRTTPIRQPTVEGSPAILATPTLDEASLGPSLPSGWSEVARVPPGKKRIALTFDAGDKGEPLPLILAALRERNVQITMFFTGKFAVQYPEGVKQAALDGHEIANHTYSHLDSLKLTDEQLVEELARTEQILTDLTGVSSKPFWRPPYGSRNNRVLNTAVAQGYRSVYWTLDSLDSVGQPKTADFIFNRITNPAKLNLDGAIILQHFGFYSSADALPRVLDRLDEMGLEVVTVSRLLSP